MLYRSLYRLFEAQQTFWHEISSIDELNIEVWGSLSKEEQTRECINFDTPPFFIMAHIEEFITKITLNTEQAKNEPEVLEKKTKQLKAERECFQSRRS